jgi:hypothetical protein
VSGNDRPLEDFIIARLEGLYERESDFDWIQNHPPITEDDKIYCTLKLLNEDGSYSLYENPSLVASDIYGILELLKQDGFKWVVEDHIQKAWGLVERRNKISSQYRADFDRD